MKYLFLKTLLLATSCTCFFKNINLDRTSNDGLNDGGETAILEPELLNLKGGTYINPNDDLDQYLNLGREDDEPFSGQQINAAGGNIVGLINTYSKGDQFFYGVRPIDEDWYRLQTAENRQYKIEFSAPNKSYCFRIYKLGAEANRESLRLIEEDFGEANMNYSLKVGTYLFQVTCLNKDDVIPTKYYTLTYCDKKVNPTFYLTETNKSKYKVAIWENDMIPPGVNRWRNKGNTVISHSYSDRYGSTVSGTADYKFASNKGELILDSVIYIWDKDMLYDVLQVLKVLDDDLKRNYAQDQNVSTFLSIAQDTGDLLLTIIGTACETAHPLVGLICNAASVVMTIGSLVCSLVQNKSATSFIPEMDALIGKLEAAFYWVSNYSIETVVCIPRYSYWDSVTRQVKYDAVESYSYWGFTYQVDDSVYYEYFDYTKSYISSYQSYTINNKTKTFHGSIKKFEKGEDLCDYIGIDYEEYVGNPLTGDEEMIGNVPMYEKLMNFKSQNSFTQYAKVAFENSGNALFFTRGERDTHIEIYNSHNVLLASNDDDGYQQNAFIGLDVQSYKTYIIKVTMKNISSTSEDWACLDIVQANSYNANNYANYPKSYNEIKALDPDYNVNTYNFSVVQNTTSVVKYVAPFGGGYCFETSYVYHVPYHLIALNMGSYNTWEYDHATGSNKDLQVDYVNLAENEDCLILIARDDKTAPILTNNNESTFTLTAYCRYVDGEW